MHGEGKWFKEGVFSARQLEYQVIAELSQEFPVTLLCNAANVQRSSFYNWKATRLNPSKHEKSLMKNIQMFFAYHKRFPSHGYRWLNAKIKLDKKIEHSDPYAHKCCKLAGIKCKNKHYRYKKPGDPYKIYPNLLMAGLNVTGPMQCVVSDMTAFRINGVYYELTLYMDLWNNEILTHALSAKRGDRMTYISGLKDLLELKAICPKCEMVLHTDQGSVYASKAFNELLPMYNVTRSMSSAGTPTDNAAMESINGWIKSEMFTDLHVTGKGDITQEVARYIHFYNEERPAYALGYLTPKQYKAKMLKAS